MILFKQITLDFLRDSGEGYYQSGRWVEGSSTPFQAEGNLQPYDMGVSQMTLPEGLKSENVYIFRTKTSIQTVDQFTFETADTTVIDGLNFIALKSANWNKFPSMSLNHYEVMLTRKDKTPNGEL